MEVWEFLIQRDGDRGWRPISTGNLQLTQGKYRILARSSLINTQIYTRVTYQNLGEIHPQRKSQARERWTNARGLVVILPLTELESGIWQFVCSGLGTDGSTWHRVLKLRVLPRNQPESPPLPIAQATVFQPSRSDFNGDSTAPTEPLIPMQLNGEPESWADGIDRLLAQLDRDSLEPAHHQQHEPGSVPNLLELTAISVPPDRSIQLDRSTFTGVIPGDRLMIQGSCNLQLFTAKLIQKVQMSKLLICLRYPQTGEMMLSIEHSIPPDLAMFAFSGQIQLPIDTTLNLITGEVNLYDRYNIQMATTSFTVMIDLDPLHESEPLFLQLPDDLTAEDEDPYQLLDRLTRELQPEASPSQRSPYPQVPVVYRRESPTSELEQYSPPPVFPQTAIESHLLQPSPPATGDLELDFDRDHTEHLHHHRQWDPLEMMVD